MRLAYADPPYPGKANLYREGEEVDHYDLIHKLVTEYDGWALSTDERNLAYVLSMCSENVRVLAWCKPNAVPFHGPWQAWEPVICMPARPERAKIASYYVANRPAAGFCRKGFTGSKPLGFCEWLIRCLGADSEEDTLDDLFPGTGVMGEAWEKFQTQLQLLPPPAPGVAGRYQMLRRSHEQLPGMPEPRVTRERSDPESNVA